MRLAGLSEQDRPDIGDFLAAAQEERQAVLDAFPLTGWPQLPLDRYALGTGATQMPYCALLEFHTNHLGSMRGGSARKHIIYFQRDGQWWLSGTLAGLPPEDAWARLRAQFVDAFAAVAAGDFDRLDDLELLRHGPALVTKSLAVYFPAQYVPIYSAEHLRHYIGVFGAEPEPGPAWRLNRQLWRLVSDHPVLGGWQPLEVMRLLYDGGFAAGTETETVWKIAPGERGRFWDACREGGYICVGWHEVGDLAQYPTDADLQSRLGEEYPDSGGAYLTRLARDLLKFRDLPPGARVLANRGQSQVLAVGTVTSDGYRYVPGEEYPHRIGVAWDTSYAQMLDSPQPAWTSTFSTVSQQLWTLIKRHRGDQPSTEAPELPNEVTRVCKVLARKGQVILHGPPGTGKTRLALDVALAVSGNVDALTGSREVRAEHIRRMLRPPAVPGQAVWLFVANQKQWSWSELEQQGTVQYRRGRISSNYERMRPGDLVVGYEATPVKKVLALSRITSVDLTSDAPIQLTWMKSIDGPTYEQCCSDPVLAASEPVRHRMQGTAFSLTPAEAELILGDDAPAANDDDEVPTVNLVTFHPSYGYEDFVEAYKPTPSTSGGLSLAMTDGFFVRLCAAATQHRDRTYLLIIDEINRADLPRVLGELITLLEPDKRDVPVVLPVSGRSFRIPPNVKIIGTMNTADRSVAHLDAAVRRRFGFVAVPPDPTVLTSTVGPVDLSRLLAAINNRIAEHLDADHTLGHSFFLRDDAPVTTEVDVHAAFYDEVLPLLEDYVVGDHQLLAALLGEELVDARTGQVATMDPEDLLAVLAKEFRVGLADDVPEA